MRKESSTVQKCKRQMATLGFDSQLAYHRVKLILKIYRDVVWVLSERVEELHEYAWELGDQDADTGLIYLQSFAPDMDLQEFEERVCCVMENRMLVDVIDRALLRLKRYPDRGELYRRSFWTHRPLTDFWRVGKGYAAKLEAHGLYTMGDIARCSIGQPTDYHNEELLYKLFGVNAELLIDHAWGWEPCTIADIKAYKPENKSIVSGQILQYPYPFEKARLVIQEMADALALELVDKRLATNQLVLTVGYDIENLKGTAYTGEITTDHYGRKIPKHAHGTVNLDGYTSSGEELLKAATSLYDRIVDKTLLARRLTLCANHLLDESSVPEDLPEQIDLFTDYSAKEKQKKEADTAHARERKLQKTMLGIKKRFGKNAILKGLNLEDGATARERNNQIGGHKA